MILTIEKLRELTETEVPCPALSALAGADVAARIRRVARTEAASVYLPAESAQWPVEEWASRQAAWFAGLSAEARRRHDAQLVALALLAPRLTAEEALQLGDDLELLVTAVLRHSELIGTSAPAPVEIVVVAA